MKVKLQIVQLTGYCGVCGFLAVALTNRALTEKDLLETIRLAGDTHHVQGIELDGSRLWLTSVDVPDRRGLLLQYRLPEGTLEHSVAVHDGSRYHPGGISGDAQSLWVPVADYRRDGSSVIQKRSKQTLEIEDEFEVPDHIGCIAVTPEYLIGANWDARDLYVWTHRGKLLRKLGNPTANAFQDMKFVDGKLVGSGLLKDKSGAIDWMQLAADASGIQVVRRITTGKTERGVAYTHEGMTIRNGKLWLLPEDTPSRLFVFRLIE
jgi:hypothetical protein